MKASEFALKLRKLADGLDKAPEMTTATQLREDEQIFWNGVFGI
jgi:hypothetical protein